MPARFARARTAAAVSSMAVPWADTVGRRMRSFSSSRYSRACARTCSSNFWKRGTASRLGLSRHRRRPGLALPELAFRRNRGHLDPPLLAEVVHDAVRVLERLAPIDLGPRDHAVAVAAVNRAGAPAPARV